MTKPNRGHGSPYDRGHADAYYGRPGQPNKKDENDRDTYDLTPEEIVEYNKGFDDCDDRKDWS